MNQKYNHEIPKGLTMPIFNQLNDREQWMYSPKQVQFTISYLNFKLIVKNACLQNNRFVMEALLYFCNGRPLTIAPEYNTQFLQHCNKNSKNNNFQFTVSPQHQLILTTQPQLPEHCETSEKISRCLQCIESSQKDFMYAQQLLGLKCRFNGLGLKIRKLELEVKREVARGVGKGWGEGVEGEEQGEQGEQGEQSEQGNGKGGNLISAIFDVRDIREGEVEVGGPVRSGGFFKVEPKRSLIIHHSGDSEQKSLAWKTPISPQLPKAQQKIQRQLSLLKQIKDNRYLLTYYTTPTCPTTIFMQYMPQTLKQTIYLTRPTSKTLLILSQHLVSAVQTLHNSNIVHRDLKPENILISGENIKIIDFSQSSLIQGGDGLVDNSRLGCTVPYSPVECMLRRVEGVSAKEIDLWSVPVILYEMTFKTIPLFYSRILDLDVLESWRQGKEFSIFPIFRKQRGMRLIQQLISLICIRGIKEKPSQRMNLKTYRKLLSHLRQYLSKLSETEYL